MTLQYRQQLLGSCPILPTNEAWYCPPVAFFGEILSASGKRGFELPLMLWKKLLTQVCRDMSIWVSKELAPRIPQFSSEIRLRIQNLMMGIHPIIDAEKIPADLFSLSNLGQSGMSVVPAMIPDIKMRVAYCLFPPMIMPLATAGNTLYVQNVSGLGHTMTNEVAGTMAQSSRELSATSPECEQNFSAGPSRMIEIDKIMCHTIVEREGANVLVTII